MNRYFWVFIALAMMSCQTQESRNPEADMASMSTCQKVAYVISDNRASRETKQAASEVGRNSGCFGQPQTQHVQIDQTVRVR